MSKSSDVDRVVDAIEDGGKYEYRVWGKYRKARKMLAEMASEQLSETIEDCYFLVDDLELNAKVRDDRLKVKQLVASEKGFEVWTSDWHKAAKTAPPPFDDLFKELRLDKKSFDLRKAVSKLDAKTAATAVFVTKTRRRFRIGSLRAEYTDVQIDDTGEVLHTLAIEGEDLDELVALRKKLGIRKEDNIGFAEALDNELS